MYVRNHHVLYNILTETLMTRIKKKCVFWSARFSRFIYSRRLWKFRRIVTRKGNNEHATHALAYAQLLSRPALNAKYRLSTSVILIVQLLQYILCAFIFRRHWMRYPLDAAWFSSFIFFSDKATDAIFKSNFNYVPSKPSLLYMTIYIFIRSKTM